VRKIEGGHLGFARWFIAPLAKDLAFLLAFSGDIRAKYTALGENLRKEVNQRDEL
jgi:hypothetical protein